jgi:hypothetical protein
LRRWPKAASTAAKVASRSASSPGGSRRTTETRTESTLGTGQKTLREIREATVASPHQATLTLGTP